MRKKNTETLTWVGKKKGNDGESETLLSKNPENADKKKGNDSEEQGQGPDII
jgi:hypothetical protein